MMEMLLTVIPAALAGTAVLAFFWTLVLRINDLEKRMTDTAIMPMIERLHSDRQATAVRLEELAHKLDDHAQRHGRAIEAASSMMSAMRAEMNDQQERVSALIDLRLSRVADEMAFDMKRVQLAYNDLRSMMVVTPAAVAMDTDIKPAAKEAAVAGRG